MKKSIKRISSLALALVMLASAMPIAFATDKVITEVDVADNPEGNFASDTTQVTVTIAERYSFTFPDAISIASADLESNDTNQLSIDYTDLRLAPTSSIGIEVYGTGYREQEAQQDDPTKVPCTLGQSENQIILAITGGRTATVNQANAGGENYVTLSLASANELNNKPAGDYVGTLNVRFTYLNS